MATKGGLILILTRYLLQPSEYGRLFLAISVLTVTMLFANLGIPKAGARYITEYREKSPDLVSVVIRRTLLYNCLAILTVCVGIVLLHRLMASWVGEPTIAVLLLMGIGYVVLKSLTGTYMMFFQGLNRMDWTAIMNIISNIVLILSVPILVLLGFGIEGALFGYILSAGVATVIGSYIIYSRVYESTEVTEEEKGDVSSRILQYSAPLAFTQSSNVIYSRADTILLSVFRGPTAIAFYTLGKQIADFLVTPAHSLGFGISPTYGEQKANDNQSNAARLYERSFIYTVIIYGPAAAGIVLVADPAIRLIFGNSYAGTAPVLQVFSVFVFVRALDAITSDALDYMGRARSRAIAKGTLTVGNVVLNLLLIPPFGIIGATAATVLTYGLYVVGELFIIVDELPIDTWRLLRSSFVVGIITFCMSAVVYPLLDRVSDIPSLAGVIFVGGLAWFVLTVLSGVIDLRQLYASIS